MSKLDELGVSGNVMRWIGNFQTQRLIRIEILNAVSKFKTQKQGLPQDAVLSCTLLVNADYIIV